MNKLLPLLPFLLGGFITSPLIASDFGNADFSVPKQIGSPKSYHDAWCRQLRSKCRVRFQNKKMWVEGFGEIKRSQLLGFRFTRDGGQYGKAVHGEKYYYLDYLDNKGKKTNALFLFANNTASQQFGNALINWYKQDARPYPNHREPESQGPQDTQEDSQIFRYLFTEYKEMNPYEKPLINDSRLRTTE